jgi:hypothetical protein
MKTVIADFNIEDEDVVVLHSLIIMVQTEIVAEYFKNRTLN